MRKVFIFQVEDLDSPERATCSFFSLKDKEPRVRSEIEHHPISLAVSPVCEYLREASSRSCRRFNSSERDRLVSQFSWKPSSGEKKKKRLIWETAQLAALSVRRRVRMVSRDQSTKGWNYSCGLENGRSLFEEGVHPFFPPTKVI